MVDAIDWSSPIVRLVLGFTAVSVIAVVGFYFISRLRAQSLQQAPTSGELLQNFRELHSEGVLSDVEFRTIRQQLSQQVVDETRHTARVFDLPDLGSFPPADPVGGMMAGAETHAGSRSDAETQQLLHIHRTIS